MKRLTVAAVYVLYLVFVTASATWVGKVSQSLSEEGSGGIVQVFQGLRDPLSQFPGKSRITILLVGKDYNRDKKGMEYTKNSRSDTIMMMSVDLLRRKIGAISVPRDTKVTAPDGITGKINGTYSRGGIDLLAQTLHQEFGVDFDYAVAIKPDAVKEIVNALGGVTVETIDEMHYDDNWGQLHIHLPKGVQRIDGEQAIGFTRFREVNVFRPDSRGRLIPIRNVKHSLEEGDGRRMARQQQLIRAMIAEANHPSNLWKADQVIDTGFRQLETNMKRIQLLALATLFRGAGDGAIQTVVLDGAEETSRGAFYILLDRERAQATVDWIIDGDEIAGNRTVRVAVYNSTEVSGAAKQLAERLKEAGFDARAVGNAPELKTTEVLFKTASVEERARMISTLTGGGTMRKVTVEEALERQLGRESDDVIVVVGSDLAEQLVAFAP